MYNLGIIDKIWSGKEIDNNGGCKGEVNGIWEGMRRCLFLEDFFMVSVLCVVVVNLDLWV